MNKKDTLSTILCISDDNDVIYNHITGSDDAIQKPITSLLEETMVKRLPLVEPFRIGYDENRAYVNHHSTLNTIDIINEGRLKFLLRHAFHALASIIYIEVSYTPQLETAREYLDSEDIERFNSKIPTFSTTLYDSYQEVVYKFTSDLMKFVYRSNIRCDEDVIIENIVMESISTFSGMVFDACSWLVLDCFPNALKEIELIISKHFVQTMNNLSKSICQYMDEIDKSETRSTRFKLAQAYWCN